MNVKDPGHIYEVEGYDGADPQLIVFMKRIGAAYPGNKDAFGGTNCQELLRVLIDRVKHLQRQISCDENTAILQHLRMALLFFELRAAQRHDQHLPKFSIHHVEHQPVCPHCGHIICGEDCQ